jgi:amino acid adenylation domain-containing protein
MSDLLSLIADSLAQQRAIQARCFHPSNTFVAFRKEAIEQSIPDRFEEQVRRYPDRIAVKDRNEELTYTDLDRAANRLSHAILACRGERPEPVALLFERTPSLVVAILGALKAGKILVILDPFFPQARLASMLEDSQAALLVTGTGHLVLAQEFDREGQAQINVDDLDPGLALVSPGLSLSPDACAQIHYTSGSTGQPKGVAESHRGLLHAVMRQTNDFHICAHDRVVLPASSETAFYQPLLNGAALHLWNSRREGWTRLPRWMIQEEVTIYGSVASAFRQFVDALTGEERFSHLRLIRLGGEPVFPSDGLLYQRYFSDHCIFAHGLGTTEAGHFRQYFLDKAGEISDSVVPVGYAVEGTEVVLLDDDGSPVGTDQTGEIGVKSRYLALGYWGRPDLTEAAFRPDPQGGDERVYLTGDLGRMLPDGCLLHLGRKDFQVQIGGNRVEIAEIETALLDLDGVKQAVVVAWEAGVPLVERESAFASAARDESSEAGNSKTQRGAVSDQRLVAYLVPAVPGGPTVTELRRALAAKLPGFMLPSAFVILEALPVTGIGKVDRRALPPPGRARPDLESTFVAPRTPVEEVLAGLWGTLLALDVVGIHDSFFDLGGHSLLATQMLSRVQEAFRCEVPLRALFDAPTVAGLAGALVASEREPGGTERMARVRQRVEQMSAEEVRAALQQRQGERGAIT